MKLRDRPQGKQPLDRLDRLLISARNDLDRREVVERAALPRTVAGTVQHPSRLAGEPVGRGGVAAVCLGERSSGQRHRGAALVGDGGSQVSRLAEAVDSRSGLAERPVQMAALCERERFACPIAE